MGKLVAKEEQEQNIFAVIETESCKLHEEHEESGWIVKNNLNIADAITIKIIKKEGEQLLACAQIIPAEKSALKDILQLPEESLTKSILIGSVWISPHNKDNLLPAVLYFVLRRAEFCNVNTSCLW